MNELGYAITLEDIKVRFNCISNHPDIKHLLFATEKEIFGMAGVIVN
jgi:hypothetical protein